VLAAGAYYTGRTFALNREGQITERFTRAVEQLANKELDIRLGGIYALGRIARDSETHYEPAIEVLTAFLREHTRPGARTSPSRSGPESGEPAPTARSELRVDFQAAAAVLGKRDRRHERSDYRLDLRGVDLSWASLREADLAGAVLSYAHLQSADLSKAKLREVELNGSHLERADLSLAHLGDSELIEAHMERADLSGAYLTGADLARASLVDAHLEGADLTAAYLPDSHLERASLRQAFLEAADLSGASLHGADLRGADGLTREQLAEAITNNKTKLPEYLDREGGE
jgi:uncharacterized protein YjbI with pentapeptide repeats